MTFLGVFRWPSSSSAFLVRSQRLKQAPSKRSSSWELPSRPSQSCTSTGTTGLTESRKIRIVAGTLKGKVRKEYLRAKLMELQVLDRRGISDPDAISTAIAALLKGSESDA